MSFDLAALLEQRRGEAATLHRRFVNPALVDVLGLIGFEPEYVRGQGIWLESASGERFLDALSGYGVFALGRNHPAICDAIRQATALDLPNLVQMDTALLSGLLAEAFVEIAPPGLDAVFFTNSGTEAVEGAIKFARCATGRERILFHKGAFHGLTSGALALNGDESFREGFGDLLPGCDAFELQELDAVEAQLRKEDVAAVFIEPIRGKGVYLPHDDRALPDLQALCRKYGTLFVTDEIQTGMGRTGKMWAGEHWNLEPDIMTAAKALSGGLVPVGVIAARREVHKKVFSRLDRCVVHSSTFGQNVLAMAAGLATLQLYRETGLVEHAAKMGERLLGKLTEIGRGSEIVRDVRGRGLMVAMEFGPPSSLLKKPAWSLLHRVENGLFAQALVMRLYGRHHILTQVAGHHLEVIKLLPPLIVNESEVDQIVDGFTETLTSAGRFPGPIWDFGSKLAAAAAKQSLRRKTP